MVWLVESTCFAKAFLRASRLSSVRLYSQPEGKWCDGAIRQGYRLSEAWPHGGHALRRLIGSPLLQDVDHEFCGERCGKRALHGLTPLRQRLLVSLRRQSPECDHGLGEGWPWYVSSLRTVHEAGKTGQKLSKLKLWTAREIHLGPADRPINQLSNFMNIYTWQWCESSKRFLILRFFDCVK